MTKFDKHVIKISSKNLFKEFFFSFLTLTRSATPRAITSDTLSGAKSKQNETKQNKTKNKKQKTKNKKLQLVVVFIIVRDLRSGLSSPITNCDHRKTDKDRSDAEDKHDDQEDGVLLLRVHGYRRRLPDCRRRF